MVLKLVAQHSPISACRPKLDLQSKKLESHYTNPSFWEKFPIKWQLQVGVCMIVRHLNFWRYFRFVLFSTINDQVQGSVINTTLISTVLAITWFAKDENPWLAWSLFVLFGISQYLWHFYKVLIMRFWLAQIYCWTQKSCYSRTCCIMDTELATICTLV